VALRLIQVTARAGFVDTLKAIAESDPVIDHRIAAGDDETCTVSMLVGPEDRQALLDTVQSIFDAETHWRIVVLPVEATMPSPEDSPDQKERLARAAITQTREELYNDVARGAALDQTFVLLVALSTVVASVGMIAGNVAVIIGGMVIAPLLGPNLAMTLAAALGDRWLMARAIATNVAGIGLAVVLGALIGLSVPIDPDSAELLLRTDVGPAGAVLALAAGAAAALSITSGVASALVGVMVAVALLPPAAAAGLMLGAQQWPLALGAALLLAVNVVCVNLAGQLVFLARGIKPRTWLERVSARQSVRVSVMVWVVSLALLSAVMYLRTL